jgi:hypothetical protein
MSALKTYQRLTYLPIQNYLSKALHYLQVLPTYPPLSLSLCVKLQYIPTYWVLPTYLPAYLLTYLPVLKMISLWPTKDFLIWFSGPPPRHSLSESLSLCPQETLVLLSKTLSLVCVCVCVCVCCVSLLWIYYLQVAALFSPPLNCACCGFLPVTN